MTTSLAHDGPMTPTPLPTPAIDATGLRKRFGDVAALDGLDLVAPAGAVTAVLGPNGAGKTTFVRAVATLASADEGSLHVAGIDAVARPRRCAGSSGWPASTQPSSRR